MNAVDKLTEIMNIQSLAFFYRKYKLWIILFVILGMLFGIDRYKNKQYSAICAGIVKPIGNGEPIASLSVSNGPEPKSIRVDYKITKNGDQIQHYVVCYFGDVWEFSTYELKRVQTEDGFLSDTNIYFLNRFFIYAH